MSESLINLCSCMNCKGKGEYKPSWTRELIQCRVCRGAGTIRTMPELEYQAIMQLVQVHKGKNKGRLRKAWTWGPAKGGAMRGHERVTYGRAYYVWRWARFHGGADVTLPVTANLEIAGDPCIDVLEILAEEVAKRAFGTDMAGARRWHKALHG